MTDQATATTWEPWMHVDCDNHLPFSEYEDGELMTDLHDVSVGEGFVHAVITEEGIFCSQGCADVAKHERQMEIAQEDRDSWYNLPSN